MGNFLWKWARSVAFTLSYPLRYPKICSHSKRSSFYRCWKPIYQEIHLESSRDLLYIWRGKIGKQNFVGQKWDYLLLETWFEGCVHATVASVGMCVTNSKIDIHMHWSWTNKQMESGYRDAGFWLTERKVTDKLGKKSRIKHVEVEQKLGTGVSCL
jgi:hypothetical protein